MSLYIIKKIILLIKLYALYFRLMIKYQMSYLILQLSSADNQKRYPLEASNLPDLQDRTSKWHWSRLHGWSLCQKKTGNRLTAGHGVWKVCLFWRMTCSFRRNEKAGHDKTTPVPLALRADGLSRIMILNK